MYAQKGYHTLAPWRYLVALHTPLEVYDHVGVCMWVHRLNLAQQRLALQEHHLVTHSMAKIDMVGASLSHR